jgi:hypothetical protein
MWQTVESRHSKRLRLKADRFQRPSPDNFFGRCFNCLSPSHLVRDCRSKTRCFKCCGLGHRASLCSVAPVCAPAISSAPKRTMWSRLGGVVPGKAFVWSCLQHRQPPEPLQSVWSRLSPPMSGGQRQTRLVDHPAASLKVWRRKASVVSDKVIQHLHQGMAADHAVGADVAANRGLSRCRHSCKRHNPPSTRDDERRRVGIMRNPVFLAKLPLLMLPLLLRGCLTHAFWVGIMPWLLSRKIFARHW